MKKAQIDTIMVGLFTRTQIIRQFLRDDNGQDIVEYALVLALIALGATASLSSLAASISIAFSNVGSHLGTYTG